MSGAFAGGPKGGGEGGLVSWIDTGLEWYGGSKNVRVWALATRVIGV